MPGATLSVAGVRCLMSVLWKVYGCSKCRCNHFNRINRFEQVLYLLCHSGSVVNPGKDMTT